MTEFSPQQSGPTYAMPAAASAVAGDPGVNGTPAP